jgi:hypothetical protein
VTVALSVVYYVFNIPDRRAPVKSLSPAKDDRFFLNLKTHAKKNFCAKMYARKLHALRLGRSRDKNNESAAKPVNGFVALFSFG